MFRLALVFLLASLSCNSDYALNEEVPPPPPAPEPDILVAGGSLIVDGLQPGCESPGSFRISNVGEANLTVDQIDVFASAPVDSIIQPYSNRLPVTIIPGDYFEVEFMTTSSDNVDDAIIAIVHSDDPDESIVQTQVEIPSAPGELREETFEIEEAKSADIILVVDNSGSMLEEQTELASNAQLFVDELNASNIDYRIAVITTDSSYHAGPFITPYTSNPASLLASEVLVGIFGSAVEMGLYEAKLALEPPGFAAPGGSFLRENARLSIVWISDEDDFSVGDVSSYVSDFWSKKSSPGEVSVWGIIGDPMLGCSSAQPGDRYYDIITIMGGGWTSICSRDWGAPLSAVAGSVGVDSVLELSGNPAPATIEVKVNGTQTWNWVYVVADNSISFNPGHIPNVGSRVVVSYQTYGECD